MSELLLGSFRATIPKLNSGNWKTWYEQMKAVLRANGCLYVLGKDYENDKIIENEKEDKHVGLALTIIMALISDEDREFILGCHSPKLIIEKLKVKHLRPVNSWNLNEEFVKMKWSKDESATVFISKLNNLRIRMKAFEPNIEDGRFIHKLLSEIPSFLNHVKENLELSMFFISQTNNTEFSQEFNYENLCNVVIRAYNQKIDEKKSKNTNHSDAQVSFLADAQSRKRYPCRGCGQKNHLFKDCPSNRYDQVIARSSDNTNQQSPVELQSNRTSNDSRSSPSEVLTSSLFNAVRNPENQVFELCSMASSQAEEDVLYFDNASNYHITNRLEHFFEYKPYVDEKSIVAVNGGFASGIGKILVQGKLAGKNYQLILSEVLFIPNSPAVIFSQIAAENKGCKFVDGEDDNYLYYDGYLNGVKQVSAKRKKFSRSIYRTNLVVKNNLITTFFLQTNPKELHSKGVNKSLISNGDCSNQIIEQQFEFGLKASEVEVPKSTKQVMSNKYRDLWLEASDQEFLALKNKKVFELVERTKDIKLLPSFMLYSLKTDEDGNVTKFKARFVINGNCLKKGTHYSPVPNFESLRILLACAVKHKYHIHTLDIKNAYLNSRLTTPVFTSQPKMYVNPQKPSHILKVVGNLYGHPDAAFNWYETFRDFLISLDFVPSKLDSCVYRKQFSNMYLLVHVDDMVIIASDLNELEEFKKKVNDKFQCRDNGPIKLCLGIEFDYRLEDQLLFMCAKSKINQLYEDFKDKLPKATFTPVNDLIVDRPSPMVDDIEQYQSIIGLLNYLAYTVRPDISVYVNQLIRFMTYPTVHHETLVLQIVSYLYETRNRSLCYDNIGADGRIHVFSDSNANDLISQCKANTGSVVMYNKVPLTWLSKRQTVISDEPCLAELFAINMSLKLALGIRNLMIELQLLPPTKKQIQMYVDNTSARQVAIESVKKKSRHYHITLLFVKDYIERKELVIVPIKSADNLADLNTKFVSDDQFCKYLKMLNMRKHVQVKS